MKKALTITACVVAAPIALSGITIYAAFALAARAQREAEAMVIDRYAGSFLEALENGDAW